MNSASYAQRLLQTAEQELDDQSGPLVTQEQLERILAIGQTQDLDQRVARLNEVYADLQRQLAEAETRWQLHNDHLKRSSRKMTLEEERWMSHSHARAMEKIHAEARQLLQVHGQTDGSPGSTVIPKRRRMNV